MLCVVMVLSLLFPPLTFQKFVIIGTIRDTAGRSVPNVRVLAIDENFQPIRTIFVDGSGQFFIRGLSPGRYQFRVDTTGTPYKEHETGWIELNSIRVRPGGSENYPLDIVLKLKPSKNVGVTESIFVQNVPETARRSYEQGAKLLQEGQTEPGIASLKQAIELFPDYFNALDLLGKEYVKTGQHNTALPLLQRAIQLNQRASGSYYALGVAHLKLNQYDLAIEWLNKSASFDPANANTQMMLGMAQGYQRRWTESEASFKKALQLGGAAFNEAHFYLAGVYEKQQRFDDAAAALERYLKESREIKDPDKIRQMIRNLKAKKEGATK